MPYVEWGRSCQILFRASLTVGGLGTGENRFWSEMGSHSFSWQGVVSNSVDWLQLVWATVVSIINTTTFTWHMNHDKHQHKYFYIHFPERSHHELTLYGLPYPQPTVHSFTDSDKVSFITFWLSLVKSLLIMNHPTLYWEGGWYVLLLWIEVNILPAVNSVWW